MMRLVFYMVERNRYRLGGGLSSKPFSVIIHRTGRLYDEKLLTAGGGPRVFSKLISAQGAANQHAGRALQWAECSDLQWRRSLWVGNQPARRSS